MLRTPLCDALGIDLPIVLAGMGSGTASVPTPPKLVAEVSNAGGLGVLGGATLSPGELRRRIREVRRLTSRPFGVDLLLPTSLADTPTDRNAIREQLRREYPAHLSFVTGLHARYGLTPIEADGDPTTPDLVRQQVDVVLQERVPVLAAGLGDPAWVVPLAHEAGITVIGLAGNVRNARRQVEAGVDYVVAQGTEAGGHTGRIATFPLVPQVVDAVQPVPVIAAGGIADGRGLVAALALGAVGVWCGTLFLMAEESAIFPAYQEGIARAPADDFVITRAYTGKTARDLRNEIIALWDQSGIEPLPMPLQWVLMEDFVAAAEAANRFDLVNVPAGQAGGLLDRRRPAAEIVASMVEEARAVIQHLSRG